jgi:hypothetical protein
MEAVGCVLQMVVVEYEEKEAGQGHHQPGQQYQAAG